MSTLNYITLSTSEYVEKMPKSSRKKYGQFFTSEETATFMASLFSVPSGKKELKILDAGAGSGILSAALIERLERDKCKSKIKLVCYENDPNVLGLLKENLNWIQSSTSLDFSYEVREDNYILSQYLEYNGMLGGCHSPEKFDLIIGNPPYMKVGKDAPEATAMPDICYGAPNTYFLFASMGAFNLCDDGEMVYIIPRSWTSGAYFKKFREKFLSEVTLEHIHLFVSRDKVFDKESVLQETMIIKVKKNNQPPENVRITTTQSNFDFSNITSFYAPYNTVVSENNSYVYLATNEQEIAIMKTLSIWNDTLPKLGIPMKTGLTVDFRNRDLLRNDAENGAVPLFFSQHIKDGKVIFPVGREGEYIQTDQQGLLQDNANYLFVKRFTAKEEHRRLQCGVYLSRIFPEYKQISTQNKINFIGGIRNLSECVVYGLYVLFNSTLYDCYYRILNGSTQVNSTEINTIPIPPMRTIEEMGKKLIQLHDMSEETCDQILRSFIHEENRRSSQNPERIASAS